MSRRMVRTLVMVVASSLGAAGVVWAGGRAAQGYLGVGLRDVSAEQISAQHLKNNHGAEIVRVDHDGPAGKAGLREHDVVVEINGRPVSGQEHLAHALREMAPGQAVLLGILRDGQPQSVTATMANRQEVERRAWEQHMVVPDPDAAAVEGEVGGPAAPAGASSMGFFHGAGSGEHSHRFLGTVLGAPYTGLALEPVGPQLGEFFGVQSGVGLLVKSVEANSPGATAGMRAGDVVLRVNQVAISSEGDWTKLLHENKGKAVPVLIVRERKEQTLTLTPDAKRRARLSEGAAASGPELARLDPLEGRT